MGSTSKPSISAAQAGEEQSVDACSSIKRMVIRSDDEGIVLGGMSLGLPVLAVLPSYICVAGSKLPVLLKWGVVQDVSITYILKRYAQLWRRVPL